MCKVINRHRISRGWHALPAEDAELAANIWIDVLDRHSVPAEAYERLYFRASEARTAAMRRGEEAPDFNAELMAAQWGGPYGLAAELAVKNQDRMLEAAPCGICNGTGWKSVTRNGYRGVVPCKHTDRKE